MKAKAKKRSTNIGVDERRQVQLELFHDDRSELCISDNAQATNPPRRSAPQPDAVPEKRPDAVKPVPANMREAKQ